MIERETELVQAVSMYKHVIVYGAGMVGRLVVERLQIDENNIVVKAVAVTNKENNPDNINDVPVFGVDELLKYRTSCVVLIATLEDLHPEISKILNEFKFPNIIPVCDSLFRDLTKNRYGKEGFIYRSSYVFQSEPKLRVLFVASDSWINSGALISLVQLCSELNREHNIYTLTVLPYTVGNGGRVRFVENNLNHVMLDSEYWTVTFDELADPVIMQRKHERLNSNNKAIDYLCEIIRDEKIDIVHINTTWTYVGAIAAHRMNVPIVWHLREFLEEDQNRQIVDKAFGYDLINKSDKIITVSECLARKYDNIFDADKVQVVYNGVSIERFYSQEKEIFTNPTVSLLYVGSSSVRKGPIALVRAADKLIQSGIKGFHVNFVGEKSRYCLNELSHEIERLNLQEYCSILGPRPDVDEFYKEADISFMCSASEAFGRVTAEAMMTGCLVIGANGGATPELITDGKTGLLYHFDDSDELAEKIIYALNNKAEMVKIAAAGRRFAHEHLSSAENTKAIAQVYDEVLGHK